MKKMLIVLSLLILSFQAVLTQDYNGITDYDEEVMSGATLSNEDIMCGGGHYKESQACGYYKVYIVCPLTLTPIGPTDIDLGYINPDGSRSLYNETMSWEVQGANGWYFEATCANDVHSNETDYVYFVNPYWTYQRRNGTLETLVLSQQSAAHCEYSHHASQLRLGGLLPGMQNTYCHFDKCSGFGTFTFHPNQVVATELAPVGRYTWDVFVSVDYLTWVTPVNRDGSEYSISNNP